MSFEICHLRSLGFDLSPSLPFVSATSCQAQMTLLGSKSKSLGLKCPQNKHCYSGIRDGSHTDDDVREIKSWADTDTSHWPNGFVKVYFFLHEQYEQKTGT